MSIKNRKIPPVILRLVNAPFSALENILPMKKSDDNVVSQQNIPVHTEEDFDKFILSQYIMYLYITIFVFQETSFVYKKIIEDGLTFLRTQKAAIKDSFLRELITEYIDPCDINSMKTPSAIHLLESVIRRVRPTQLHPNLKDVISVVLAVYGKHTYSTDEVTIYRVSLQKIEGYDEPTFVLSPCFETVLDTAEVENIPSSFWKLLFSFRIQDKKFGPCILTQFLYGLSLLALPLDPTNIMSQMQLRSAQDKKTGIPFLNYLAMYLREKSMGFDYTLSPFADARRILMMRAHRFFGFGGTCISDYNYACKFLGNIQQAEPQNTDDEEAYDSDRKIIEDLLKGRPNSDIQFTKGINYEEALEAAKPDKDPTKKTKKPAAADKDDGSFADDSDTLDTSTETPQDTDKNTDDNIDRTSDVGQDSAAANTKVFLPLALPTETIDDHLLRIMVLRYVHDTDKDPTPDISPENLETLKYWCSRWLFIASIDQTKKLLVQLNLSGQLKELVP